MRTTSKNEHLLSKREIDKLRSEVLRHKKIASFKELQLCRLKKEIKTFNSDSRESQPEKRACQRIDVFLTGEFLINDQNISALIENLSLNGIYLKLSPCNSFVDIPLGQEHELKFKLPSGEAVIHNCTVKWLCKALPHNLVTCIGSEIMNPTQKYKEFLGSLFSPRENI
ncbi:MAG: PilZ domain-containing protein [Candidatus Hodarchaeales archaeon]|jgi:hypothetical protein